MQQVWEVSIGYGLSRELDTDATWQKLARNSLVIFIGCCLWCAIERASPRIYMLSIAEIGLHFLYVDRFDRFACMVFCAGIALFMLLTSWTFALAVAFAVSRCAELDRRLVVGVAACNALVWCCPYAEFLIWIGTVLMPAFLVLIEGTYELRPRLIQFCVRVMFALWFEFFHGL